MTSFKLVNVVDISDIKRLSKVYISFYVLLIVHLGIILAIDKLNAQILVL